MPNPKRSDEHTANRGFTLVELLVVVSIIAMLLALLTPALDQAIYQAELTVCGAGLDSIATTVVTRAMEKRRQYPVRTSGPEPYRITSVPTNRDDRPAIRDYLGGSLDLLVCPLAGKVDFDLGRAPANGTQGDYCMTPYALWFGWRYNGKQGMRKLGDRWTADSPTGAEGKFSLLAGDFHWYLQLAPRTDAAHPDKTSVMYNEVLQNQGGTDDPLLAPAGGGLGYVLARWINFNRNDRGLLDLNFAYEDGAVIRLNNLPITDERATEVPPRVNNYDDGISKGSWLVVPKN